MANWTFLMLRIGRFRTQSGQASIEWVGLVLMLAIALATGAAAAAGAGVAGNTGSGDQLGKQIAQRMACAADLRFSGCLSAEPDLVSAYGPGLAETVRLMTPTIEYEDGMTAVPVDFRTCRSGRCSVGAPEGLVDSNLRGDPITIFTRIIDCRDGTLTPDADCSGGRADNVYIAFWSYFTGSATGEGSLIPGTVRKVSEKLGKPTFHPDDFEHFAIRLPGSEIAEMDRIAKIGADPVRARSRPSADARVSSHKGFAYSSGDPRRLLTDARPDRAAWGPNLGRYGIYGGSHAGYIESRSSYIARQIGKVAVAKRAKGLTRRVGLSHPGGRSTTRFTPPANVRLVPLELLADTGGAWEFAVTPPWEKQAWFDGETLHTN